MNRVASLVFVIALALPIVVSAQDRPGLPPQGEPGQRRPPGSPGDRGPEPSIHDFRGREHIFGAWWKDSEVAKQLALSDDQSKQIEQKFLESRLKLIDERADLEKQETLLGAMMEEDRPDESRVGAQLDKVVAARGRLEKENAMMMLSIRRVLSVDQWKKLQMIQHQRERMGRGEYSPVHPSMLRPGPEGPDDRGPGRWTPDDLRRLNLIR